MTFDDVILFQCINTILLRNCYYIKSKIKMLKSFCKKYRIRPAESIWLAYVHILALTGLVYCFYRYDLLLKILAIYIIYQSVYFLGVTAGSHRLWAHRSYSASLPMRIFLMLMNSGMFQGTIYHWSRDHRLHHKFSDTDLDPHTINKGFWYAHVGWLLVKKSPGLVKAGKQIDLSDLKNDPVVMFQKKYYFPLSILMCFIVPSTVFFFVLNIGIFQCFILSMLFYSLSLNATWCVNSVCHMFGSRKWNPNIQPRDNFFVSLWANGQGYHNWHHEYPSDWRASKDEWYMINVTTRFIQICSWMGLAKIK